MMIQLLQVSLWISIPLIIKVDVFHKDNVNWTKL